MQPAQFAAALQRMYDEHLLCVLLYGSTAGGEVDKKISDANVLVVLKTLAAAELQKAAPLVRTWVRNGNPVPVFFDTELIQRAVDVFPIEFLDLQHRRKVLIGADPFTSITVRTTHLRHQCESELRGKLLQLTAEYLTQGHRPKELKRLLLQSASTFFAIFRGVLRLTGTGPAAARRAMLEQLMPLLDVPSEILYEICDVREGTRVWRNAELTEKFEQYLTAIRAVIRFVDQHSTKE